MEKVYWCDFCLKKFYKKNKSQNLNGDYCSKECSKIGKKIIGKIANHKKVNLKKIKLNFNKRKDKIKRIFNKKYKETMLEVKIRDKNL